MFGFSLQKLLLLAAVIGAVWYGFKLISRLQQNRELEAGRQGRAAKRSRGPDSARAMGDEPETMVQCPICGTYVAAQGAKSCGRSDCPY